jgi:hypothetical protein
VALGLCAFACTGAAIAGPITEKLRACLSIEDVTKVRLDCYDAIVPPTPKPKPPPAKIITDCKFLREEDERLRCFNRFLEMPMRHGAAPVVPRASVLPAPPAVRSVRPTYIRHGRGGCGSRGGAGYRLPSGRCASRRH